MMCVDPSKTWSHLSCGRWPSGWVHLDRRMDSVEKQIAELRGELRAAIKNGFRYIVSQLRLDQRLGRLEEENQRRKQLPENQ